MSSLTRREYFAAAGFSLAAACGRKHGAGFPGYAVIATAGENSVSVVDLSSFRFVRQVAVGASPRAVLAGGANGSSFVLTPGTGSVHLLDADFSRVKSVRFGDRLADFKLSLNRKTLFAIDPLRSQLIAADSRSLQVNHRWNLPAPPVSLDVSVDNSVAIGSGPAGLVQLLNGATGQLTSCQLKGALALGEVRFRADGKLLIVTNKSDRCLTLLSVPSLQVIVELPLAMEPENLCFNFDGGQLFVSGHGMDGVAIVFPYDTYDVDQTVLAGHTPGALVCSSGAPAYLFVASVDGSDVCILDIDSRKMVGAVEVGQQPGFMLVTPDSQYALVLNQRSGDLAIIHISAIPAKLSNADTMRGKVAASLFTMFPVGSDPVHAAIVPRNA